MSSDYAHLQTHPKWGFITYRCDYRDDSIWAHFMNRWSQWVNQQLITRGGEQLLSNLEWTVIDDRFSLDRATVEDVREVFTAWTKTDEAVVEQQRAIDHQVLASPRYRSCVHVDAKALDACLRFDALPENVQLKFWCKTRDPALGHAPYVNIVEMAVDIGSSKYDDEEEEYDEEEEGEGEEKLISIKVHWWSVIPHSYFSLNQAPNAFEPMARDVDQDSVHLG